MECPIQEFLQLAYIKYEQAATSSLRLRPMRLSLNGFPRRRLMPEMHPFEPFGLLPSAFKKRRERISFIRKAKAKASSSSEPPAGFLDRIRNKAC